MFYGDGSHILTSNTDVDPVGETTKKSEEVEPTTTSCWKVRPLARRAFASWSWGG
jgi:hypothetical protein